MNSQGQTDRRYKTSAEGMVALEDRYNYWTEQITGLSFQASIALIGANWAVFSYSLESKLNLFSVFSVLFALLTLVISLIGAFHLACLHEKRFIEADRDRVKWEEAWEPSERNCTAWPYTIGIQSAAKNYRYIKAFFPLLSLILFISGLLFVFICTIH